MATGRKTQQGTSGRAQGAIGPEQQLGQPQGGHGLAQGTNAGQVRSTKKERPRVKVKVVIHEAEEGGFWAEVPAMPGCNTQGDTLEETLANIREAIVGCLSVGVQHVEVKGTDR